MPTLTERITTATVALETGVTNLLTALETCLGYRDAAAASAASAASAAASAAGGAGAWTVQSGNFTAANDAYYRVTANAVVTNPAAVEGKGYIVEVRSGTATMGGTAYAAPQVVRVSYSGGAWAYRATAEADLSNAAVAVLNSAIAERVNQSALTVGRKILWLGDSITDGSSSSNASTFSFRAMTLKILGSEKIARGGSLAPINGGVPGDDAGDALDRLPALLAQGPSLCYVQLGTNGSTDLATYQADMRSIFALLNEAGVPFAVGLVPPRGAGSDADVIERTHTYNLWLRAECASRGIPVVDTYAALVDSTTAAGTMAAAYDSGDAVHPNDAGHLAEAQVIAPALSSMIPDMPAFVASPGAPGLIANVLQAVTTGWTAANAGSGAGWSSAIAVEAADVGDVLTAGQWFKLTVDNTAGTGSHTHTRYLALAEEPAAGDVLLVAYCVKQGTGSTVDGVKVTMANSATDFAVLTEKFGIQKPGRYLDVCTVPASPTAIRFRLTVTAVEGEINVGYIGQIQVWNLTALGLVADF